MVRREQGRLAGEGDDLAAVGRLEHRAGQRLLRRPEGDLPPVEAQDAVEAARLLQVMGLAEEDAEERRLAAAVRAEDADPLALLRVEGDAAQHDRAAVRRGEVLHTQRHRSRPPLRPRTIASAFACSMVRYVAPADPAGPS